MVCVLDAASYVYVRYQQAFGRPIDEMKLHKLLYFAQRESFVQNNAPLFDATFYAWKYGPVLKEVREAFQKQNIYHTLDAAAIGELQPIMDAVFPAYAGKDSMSLSRLTHGETSWKNARQGVPEYASSDVPIAQEDIRKDARRIIERKSTLRQLGLL